MKISLNNRPVDYLLLGAALATGLFLPQPVLAASVALASAPLVSATTAKVKPNIMFIMDDSGSMGWTYLPDWANDNHPVTGTSYLNMPELFTNSGFNGVAYNPAITYTAPVHYNADGSLNTSTYPSQIGQATATGASTATKPNWRLVKRDAYGVQSTSTDNLEGSASFYTFIPGEHCATENMVSCVTSATPTTQSGVLYDKPAGLRWCNSSALTNCRSINNSTYRFPRYPGVQLTAATSATATITIANGSGGNTSVTSIRVNGLQILSGSTGTQSSNNNLADAIRSKINDCTSNISGSCQIAGYSASRNNAVVTITAPSSLGGITFTPVITIGTGGRTATPTAFSGGSDATYAPGSNVLTNIVLATTHYTYPGQTTKAATRTDCTTVTTNPLTCTYNEEMTNYANWWTYYRTRMQAMKTSVSRAFQTIDNRYRVGFNSISYTGTTDGTKFLHNNTFELAHKNSWYTKLFASNPTSSTPLRGALSNAGRMYAKKVPGQTVDPVQYSCQQNFVILSTDGYWNTGLETGSYGPLNLTGGNVGNLDGGSTPRPMKEGTTAVSNTLADVAKYYYDTDLRTSALGNCSGASSPDFPSGNPDVCTNNVFVSSTDNNVNQHMTTFTMGLGADGSLVYSSNYKNINKDDPSASPPVIHPAPSSGFDYYNLLNGYGSPTVNWPDPIANSAEERIDDLWHAAVNGQGTYFSAKDPDQIIAGFNKALSSITAKVGSAAAAATSTLNPVAENNFAYVASYTTVKWQGNLESRTINTSTGVVSETATWCVENIVAGSCASPGSIVADNSGNSTVYNCVTPGATLATCPAPGILTDTTCKVEMPLACNGTMPAKVGVNSDTRTIYTVNNAGTALIAFDAAYAAANPTFYSSPHIDSLSQWPLLTAAQKTAAAGANLVNFLRGQTGFEERDANDTTARLFRYREAVLGDALESQPVFIGPPVFNYSDAGYADFKSAQASRAGTVFMGTNDGMLHAFNSVNGVERWAYIPSVVRPNLWKLADVNYSTMHTNFVNGTASVSDVCTANCSSGSAVWRTILVGGFNAGGRGYYALDVTNPSSPLLLWEFTTAQDANVGFSYGNPIITKKGDGTWVVLVTSGYNNTSPGDGKGYLYVLNAMTGAKISTISTGVGDTTTPSGLSRIATFSTASSSNLGGFTYGGDLLGNVWRFDFNTAAAPLLFATLKDPSGNSQPVTTAPVLGLIGGKRVIFIGTGKYLEIPDLTNTQVQTQYAIMDDNAVDTLTNPAGSGRNNSTLIRQIIDTAGSTRTISANPVDFATRRGWYVDFPDSGERVNIDSKLVLGTLIVPTIVPSNTVCSPGGYGWLNYFNYESGRAVKTIVSQKYDSPIVGVNVIYIGGNPIIEVVTATNPTPEIPSIAPDFNKSGAGFTSRHLIWRELIP